MAQEKNMPLFSGGGAILALLIALGGMAAIYRFSVGLGGATNLTDITPWGLWIGMDVMSGVALAAGGFTVTAAVYIFNLKKYKPIVRPAVLTAFIGYLMVVFGLVADIGQPLRFWHPLIYWQSHSVMFEIVMCITLYTSVLALEFAPVVFERFRNDAVLNLLRMILYPLVIAGIILSYLHQSSLGALFLIMPHKLSGIWHSPIMPQLFFLSAICVGLAMVSVETILSARAFKREPETEILSGLGKGTSIALLVYLAVRLLDIALRGALGAAFAFDKASVMFLLEVGAGFALPMVLLFSEGFRKSASNILIAQLLVVLGVIVNRLNVNFFAQESAAYFPSIQEFLITIGLFALGIFLYRAAVIYLPVMHKAESK